MKSNYKFSNLCGTVYKQGNIIFTPDGNSALSPVGNRVSVFDLVNNKSRTFAFENRHNISAIALSPDSNVLISVDEEGRSLLVNFRRGTVLHHFNFKKPVNDIKFSPDGKYIAATHGAHIQVWRTPNHLLREFAPFVLHRTYTGHHDDVISIRWSADSRFFISSSRDMTCRLYTLDPVEGYRPKTFSGHRDIVLHAYFSQDQKTIYTVSRDGALFEWRAKAPEDPDSDDGMSSDSEAPAAKPNDPNTVANTRWGIASRHYFNQPNTKVTSSTFHPSSSLLIIGFSNGVFALYDLSSNGTLTNIHTLSISSEKISSISINPSGEWLAFGCKKLGQLLVWEWQSESYVLKQQGHYFDMTCLSFTSDGANIATGGEDGKIKLWNGSSGFCFVTFSEHSASISAVEFTGGRGKQVLFSASLDGTVRAYDLTRYRNFRTFTSPSPVQFSSLAVDPSGEVVAAGGSSDQFQIYLWSVMTGKLLDVLTGHEAPVSSLAFSPTGNVLVSGSWDKTVRLWSLFGRSKAVEPFRLDAEVLAVAYRPDGGEVAVSTLNGQITFWDTQAHRQTGLIEGRKDVAGGRHIGQLVTAANSASGKAFTSLSYTADGRCVIGGGNSMYVVIYDVQDGVLVKKFSVSQNLDLDGTQEFLDNRLVDKDGVDTRGDESELEDRLDTSLPGAQKGDASKRKYRPEVRTRAIRFSPTARSWAAATTDGLMIFSLDHQDSLTFDPVDLSIDITPSSTLLALQHKEYLKALLMSFKLNESHLITRVYEGVPHEDIRLVVRSTPDTYVERLVKFIGSRLDAGSGSPHMEFDLIWAREVMLAKGRWLRERKVAYQSALRALWKGLVECQTSVARMCDENTSALEYLVDQSRLRREGAVDAPMVV